MHPAYLVTAVEETPRCHIPSALCLHLFKSCLYHLQSLLVWESSSDLTRLFC